MTLQCAEETLLQRQWRRGLWNTVMWTGRKSNRCWLHPLTVSVSLASGCLRGLRAPEYASGYRTNSGTINPGGGRESQGYRNSKKPEGFYCCVRSAILQADNESGLIKAKWSFETGPKGRGHWEPPKQNFTEQELLDTLATAPDKVPSWSYTQGMVCSVWIIS